MRYFIEIAYNGKNYYGWQKQPNQVSVQQVLEHTLSALLRADIRTTGAGRTDTGVHAKQLFVHFDCSELSEIQELPFRLNSFLPPDISVKNIFSVPETAHARFSAMEREYEYLVSTTKDPFLQDFAYQIHNPPNIELMNQAAENLLGQHDFQCFARTNADVKTYYCNIKKAIWTANGSQLVFRIVADRFLRNMVRAIVGTLLEVGQEKRSLGDFQKVLKRKDRSLAGPSAPAQGLYLTRVKYPASIKK